MPSVVLGNKAPINSYGGTVKSIMKRIFQWIMTLCRVVIGVVVIKTGFDFSRGSGAFAYREPDVITGIFVMILGAYFVFSSFSRDLFGRSE